MNKRLFSTQFLMLISALLVGGVFLSSAPITDAATPTPTTTPTYPVLTARTFNDGAAVYSAAFSPDGQYVLTSSAHEAILFDAVTGAMVRAFSGHTGVVNSVAFSPDGKYVLTGSADGMARLWDTATGTTLLTFANPKDALAFVK